MSDQRAHDAAVRERVALDVDSTLAVVAGAGTGKTTALVDRVVTLVRTGAAELGSLAAITFTEASAAELRARIRDAIEVASRREPGNTRLHAARAEVDEAAVCTLHSFARRMLIEHGVDARVPPGFEVMDGVAEVADFDRRWRRFADALLEDPTMESVLVRGFATGLRPSELRSVALALWSHWDRLEDGRDAPAATGLGRVAAFTVAGAEAGDARSPTGSDHPGPGTASGGAVDNRRVLVDLDAALAFLGECSQHDDKLAEHLRTTLSEGRAQLLAADDEAAVLSVLAQPGAYTATVGRRENWDVDVEVVRAACRHAEETRQELLTTVRRSVLDMVVARLSAFALESADARRDDGRLTFHDLLVHARRLLRHHPAAAAALRRRYRRVLIDEFQDTDPIQVELAARVASAVDGAADLAQGRPGSLFVVGDPKQSIYRFRRADIEAFSAATDDIGECAVLSVNFRSVPGIIDFVNAFFGEQLGTDPPQGQAAHHDLHPSRAPLVTWGDDVVDEDRPSQLTLPGMGQQPPPAADGSSPRVGAPSGAAPPLAAVPVVTLGGAIDAPLSEVRRSAAAAAAQAISHMVVEAWPVLDPGTDRVRAVRWGDVAVLVPTRTTLPALEEAFESTGVPYRLEGAGLLWGSEEVRDVLGALRGAEDPADAVAVVGALRAPGLACGDDDLVSWSQAGGSWDPRAAPPPGHEQHPVARAMAVLSELQRRRWWSEPSALVARAVEVLYGFELALAHRRPRDHWQRLRWLLDQARRFDEGVGGTLGDFLRWAELQAAADGRGDAVGAPDPDDDAVRVMTVHGAKGREFPAVVLCGLEREDTSGRGAPAVLFDRDGGMEVRVGPSFCTAGYEARLEDEQRLDRLERLRLLYVSTTRARDHLVMCLHHKTSGGDAAAPRADDDSHGAILLEFCERRPELWRRPAWATSQGAPEDRAPAVPEPSAPRASDDSSDRGSGDDATDAARLEASEVAKDTDAARRDGRGSSEAPYAEWAQRRHRLLQELGKRPITSATALARDEEDRAPAERSGAASGLPAEVALQVGRAVHQTLATVDLGTGCDASGRPGGEAAAARAARHGVSGHSALVADMVERALVSPVVRAAAERRHWRELYVGLPLAGGGLFEGFVDLVVEADGGLWVVDYKTDRISPRSMDDPLVAGYRMQVASYAGALTAVTGRPVSRGVLLLLADPQSDHARELVLEGVELADAAADALRAAQRLVAPG